MGHIELARWADLLLIAPATADFIATMVHGRADNLLAAIYLATSALVAVAPAMNQGMWRHPASLDNVEKLNQRGVTIIGPDSGIQACGDTGPGRMEQPDTIINQASDMFTSKSLQGKKVVITAGPTREALDPVRYISNHSSGKMGYALATAALDAGADVVLISGPVNLSIPERCQYLSVISANDMLLASLEYAKKADIFIATAAVADYRAVSIAENKIKSDSDVLTINFEKNPDIVSTVATANESLFVVGFAAESTGVENYAKGKLKTKGLNAIIANDISRSDIGFNSDDNEVSWIDTDSSIAFSKRSKTQLSRDLIAQIAHKYNDQH
jgi:phosphopantothenoylcysteine decarboxylase/phosphopantothenate--cysteine ligase